VEAQAEAVPSEMRGSWSKAGCESGEERVLIFNVDAILIFDLRRRRRAGQSRLAEVQMGLRRLRLAPAH